METNEGRYDAPTEAIGPGPRWDGEGGGAMESDPTKRECVVPAPAAVRQALAPEGIRAELVLTRYDGEALTETEVRIAKAVLALLDAEQELSLSTPFEDTPLPPMERKKPRP